MDFSRKLVRFSLSMCWLALVAACASPSQARLPPLVEAPRDLPGPIPRPSLATEPRDLLATLDEAIGAGRRFESIPLREPSQGPAKSSEEALKQANNPLANMTAFNLQNYYIPELSGSDESSNQFWLRYAQPVGGWLIRASLPISRVPTGPMTSSSGIGDANAFAAYLFDTGDPGLSVGAGPLLGLPTATNNDVGTDQWSAGAAAVLFDARSSRFQYGGLITYQKKFAGSDRAEDVNFMAIQPFAMLQLGEGSYLRSAGIWFFNAENGDHSIPIGIGLGKVVKIGSTVLNFFIEPQFTILDEGVGQPEFQVFTGLNIQFMGR